MEGNAFRPTESIRRGARLVLRGPSPLRGRVVAAGAKNAALPVLAATLLTDEPIVLERVPRVRDIELLRRLLEGLGVRSERRGGAVSLRAMADRDAAAHAVVDAELASTMRASALVLGPLLARRGRVRLPLPGGCAIGARPIDQHLRGLEALGAEIRRGDGWVEARLGGGRLRGGRVRFRMPTVGGTENLLLAATLAGGVTVLENCAREPEVVDLARLLRAMGARIEGDGTSTITIEGVRRLGGARHRVVPDRIEAGTYLIGALLTDGDVIVDGCRPADLAPVLEALRGLGARIETGAPDRDGETWVRAVRGDAPLRARRISTAPHPGFPTDLQAPYLALATSLHGTTVFEETIFENRFRHVPELVRMGARIHLDGRRARVHGPSPLVGAEVDATDLRAGAALALAGLAAEGETLLGRLEHIARGYEDPVGRLRALGAEIEEIPGRRPGLVRRRRAATRCSCRSCRSRWR